MRANIQGFDTSDAADELDNYYLDLYYSNKDFRDYINKYMLNNPGSVLSEVLQHKIIIEIAMYYEKKGDYRLC